MAADQFNSLGGFSVGIPAITVVDGNGNVVSNFNNLSGNVSANKIYATNYYYSNGEPFTGGSGNGVPGSGNSTVQFNNLGNFGGSSSFTFNSVTELLTVANVRVTNNANLGDVANITISGGVSGYLLSTDGNGNLSWVGGNGTPGGSNSQMQFNDDGIFGGSAALTYDKETDSLNAATINVDDLNANTIDTGVVQVVNSVTAPNVNVSNRANVTGNLRVTGNVNFTGSPNITLGTVSNVKISGGVNGYVLTTDGLGNLSWQAGGGGSGGNGGESTAGTSTTGGGGGGSGAQTTVLIPAKSLPNTLYVYAGRGGTVGASGERSSVSVYPINNGNHTIAIAAGGSPGGIGSQGTGGSATASSGMTISRLGLVQNLAGQSGAPGQITSGTNIIIPTTGLIVTGGAGGGGSPASGSAIGATGGGITGGGLFPTIAGGTGGTTTTTPASSGQAGIGFFNVLTYFYGGAGGGGGGGGGRDTISTPGTGGRGGDGLAIIYAW